MIFINFPNEKCRKLVYLVFEKKIEMNVENLDLHILSFSPHFIQLF